MAMGGGMTMSEQEFVAKLLKNVEKIPQHASVLALRSYSPTELEERGKRFLSMIAEMHVPSTGHADWVIQKDRTLIRLPHQSRVVIQHASGAMEFVSGLGPMEALYPGMEKKELLTKQMIGIADRLKIRQWVGKNETLQFERLWQIKAGAADRLGKVATPVLCRTVGAFRHFIGDMPVWGAASVAIKLAGGGLLDSLQVQMRETTGQVVDKPATLPAELAARNIYKQLCGLMGTADTILEKNVTVQWMHFGYFCFGKRKMQKVLAPVYTAAVEIKDVQWPQAYLFVTPATEKSYLPLERVGEEVAQMQERKKVP
jgi:hypothetical protein